jgi:hypothetical protein
MGLACLHQSLVYMLDETENIVPLRIWQVHESNSAQTQE